MPADCASGFHDLLEKNCTLTKIDLRGSEFCSYSQIIADSIAKSQSLSWLCIDCGPENEILSKAFEQNNNLLRVEGFLDKRIGGLCTRNKHLREHRVDSSVVTLIAMKRRLYAVPKEIFVVIGKYLKRTSEDLRAWRI